MTLPDYGYYKTIFASLPMPFAFVDLDILNENIREVRRRSGNKKIRVASKSIRCRYLLKYILNADKQFQGLMCFSVSEAIWLCEQGFDDLLMGYPAMNTELLDQVALKVKEGKSITLMADLPAHLDHLDETGKRNKTVMPVCLDLDLSTSFPGIWFGVQRSSIRTTDNLLAFIRKVKACANVKLVGLMGYEAQIAGVADSKPGQMIMNKIIQFLKTRSVRALSHKRKEAVNLIKDEGIGLEFVNGGGTGSLESTTEEASVTEVTVGSAFYASHLFDHYKKFRHLPAAAFAVEVVRKPEEGIFTCLGGGFVASGAIGEDKAPKPYLPEGAKLLKNEMAGEVQTPVAYNGKTALSLADPVFFRHSKAGELFEHFNHIYLVSSGKIIETVPTYRGEGYTFL